jgi:hypothetical protein
MSDQTTPVEGADTAAINTPEGTEEQQTANWEERYKEAQSWGTKNAQEAAQYRQQVEQFQDPEYQKQVAQEWLSQNGYALPEDEPDTEPPPYATREEIDRINQRIEQREQAEQRDRQVTDLEAQTERKLQQIEGLDDEDKTWIVTRAISLPPAEDGGLNVEQAHTEFTALQQSFQKRWRDTKRAPRVPGSGQQATQTKSIDDMNPEELLAWQMQRLQDLGG